VFAFVKHVSSFLLPLLKTITMRRNLYILAFLLLGQQAMAQVPEDALRISWGTMSGTARHQAIGGAMGSLGGEITAAHVNPAGLGFYKTKEVVLSPGLSMLKNKADYRGTSASGDKSNKFLLGTSGFVAGFGRDNRFRARAVSITVNKVADFNGQVYYKGQNNFSSFGERFAEEAARNGLTIDKALNDPAYAFSAGLAVYGYLIDTFTINGTKQWVALPEFIGTRNQENRITTSGGVTELALGYGVNTNDKWFVGASLGVPIMRYVRNSTFRESDPTNTVNDFNYFEFRESLRSVGVGLNVKLGAIYRPVEYFRLGFAVHSPSFMSITDKYSAEMTTDMENFGAGEVIKVSSSTLNNGVNEAEARYAINTPFKFIGSASYVFREVEDTRRQKGFITADIEYVNHKWSSFTPDSDDDQQSSKDYYRELTNVLKKQYKGTFNFRVGGEVKFNTIMARAGFAYYGNPYADSELKASRMFVSGGLGYRDKGIFIDLTYVHGISKDVNFPYRLTDKANTFATARNTAGNIVLTCGFKLL
jgi:long-subunit fatty acid transport protein